MQIVSTVCLQLPKINTGEDSSIISYYTNKKLNVDASELDLSVVNEGDIICNIRVQPNQIQKQQFNI